MSQGSSPLLVYVARVYPVCVLDVHVQDSFRSTVHLRLRSHVGFASLTSSRRSSVTRSPTGSLILPMSEFFETRLISPCTESRLEFPPSRDVPPVTTAAAKTCLTQEACARRFILHKNRRPNPLRSGGGRRSPIGRLHRHVGARVLAEASFDLLLDCTQFMGYIHVHT
jgi:hypothetical protein